MICGRTTRRAKGTATALSPTPAPATAPRHRHAAVECDRDLEFAGPDCAFCAGNSDPVVALIKNFNTGKVRNHIWS